MLMLMTRMSVVYNNTVISEKYEQMDALVTCFPWCGGVTNTHCIPRSSRCKSNSKTFPGFHSVSL